MTRILTIGYGGRSLEDIRACLQRFRVTHLVDVRTSPFSRANEAFNRDELESAFSGNEIKYVFMGDKLGGRPPDRSCYDEDGKVVYDAVRALPDFRRGIDQLIRGAVEHHRVICVMCSELRPEECHRSKLIGEELSGRGVDVEHITETGLLASQEDVMGRVNGGQPDLFGEPLKSRKTYTGRLA